MGNLRWVCCSASLRDHTFVLMPLAGVPSVESIMRCHVPCMRLEVIVRFALICLRSGASFRLPPAAI